jgi:hypothetical protein
MNTIELNAYRLMLRNGNAEQIRKTLLDIGRLETNIPPEMTAAIIEMLRKQGGAEIRHWAYPISKILGKSQSRELYQVAESLKAFKDSFTSDDAWMKEKENPDLSVFFEGSNVVLFVKEKFYHPELEKLVIDELFKMIGALEQDLRVRYRDMLPPSAAPKSPKSRMHPAGQPMLRIMILRTIPVLAEIGSAEAREAMRAMDYAFREPSNDYLRYERQWVEAGDERASVDMYEHPDKATLGDVSCSSAYDLKRVLDDLIAALQYPLHPSRTSMPRSH